MLFKPHPMQVQALRIAKRFQRGFRPMKVAGEPLAEGSILAKIKFDSVPAFVLSAEIGHSTEYGDLIEELCQRGYFAKCDGYPTCPYAPMEYVTEDGTRVYVHDAHWGQIDVLPRDAKRTRIHVGGFSGEVRVGEVAAPSHRKRKPKIIGKGLCYKLTPKGFDLLDQVEAENRIHAVEYSPSVDSARLSATPAALAVGKRVGEPTTDPGPVEHLKPSHARAKALYDWAIEHIDGAQDMTYAELFEKLTGDPRCAGEGLPNNAEAFARYCRAAGVQRNTPRRGKGATRSVRRVSDL